MSGDAEKEPVSLIVVPETKAEYDNIITTSQKAVVVDFYATWCGPCRAIAPYLEQLAKEYEETRIVVKVDVDELDEVAQEAEVSAMPTFHVYKNGAKVKELVGASREKLKGLFD